MNIHIFLRWVRMDIYSDSQSYTHKYGCHDDFGHHMMDVYPT